MQLQPPTATQLRIRSISDAHRLFHAVYLNLLPMVVRRLDAEERKLIKSGDVHVWEERGPGTEATGLGIERWTDGRLWGPSRVRDCFLFYHEKDREPEDFHGGSKWARMLRRRSPRTDSPAYDDNEQMKNPRGLSVLGVSAHPHYAQAPSVYETPQYSYDDGKDRLVKQTYSVLVHLPGQQGPEAVRKWHMTAYFSSSQKAQNQLRTIEDNPVLANVSVPEGMYEPARAGRGAGRVRSGSTSSGKSIHIPPLPASMQLSSIPSKVPSLVPSQQPLTVSTPSTPLSAYPQLSSPIQPQNGHYPYPTHHYDPHNRHPSAQLPRYAPYHHRSNPGSPTVDMDSPMVVVPSHNTLPPLRSNIYSSLDSSSSSSSTPSAPHSLLHPLSVDISVSRSRSSSASSATSSHLSPQHSISSSSTSTTSPPPFSSDSLVPLPFLENLRINLSQPAGWSSARRAVDEEVLRNLVLRKW